MEEFERVKLESICELYQKRAEYLQRLVVNIREYLEICKENDHIEMLDVNIILRMLD